MVRAMQHHMFWKDLAALIDSGTSANQPGITMTRSLLILQFQMSERDNFGSGIKAIYEDILAGSTFSEAMKKSGMFSSNEVMAVLAGEVGGTLDVVVNRLASGKIPTRADQYQQFYQTLVGLCSCGVPMLTAFKRCRQGLDEPLAQAVDAIHASIKEGDTTAAAMDESHQFSALDVNLVDIGEETNSLDRMFSRLADLSGPLKL